MAQPSLPVFSALGHQTRWRTFEILLARGEDGMLQHEVAKALGLETNLMSVHLKIMRHAGLVTAERNGREVTYRVAPDAARHAAEVLLKAIDAGGRKKG